MIYIGIDNGVTGSIGIINSPDSTCKNSIFFSTPIKSEYSYTKKPQRITRINTIKLTNLLIQHVNNIKCLAVIERPMINPGRWKASMSAMRSFEATLICLENLNINYIYIDSKEWQKYFFGELRGSIELKIKSLEIGTQLFPNIQFKHVDMDGILIAEYAFQTNLGIN